MDVKKMFFEWRIRRWERQRLRILKDLILEVRSGGL